MSHVSSRREQSEYSSDSEHMRQEYDGEKNGSTLLSEFRTIEPLAQGNWTFLGRKCNRARRVEAQQYPWMRWLMRSDPRVIKFPSRTDVSVSRVRFQHKIWEWMKTTFFVFGCALAETEQSKHSFKNRTAAPQSVNHVGTAFVQESSSFLYFLACRRKPLDRKSTFLVSTFSKTSRSSASRARRNSQSWLQSAQLRMGERRRPARSSWSTRSRLLNRSAVRSADMSTFSWSSSSSSFVLTLFLLPLPFLSFTFSVSVLFSHTAVHHSIGARCSPSVLVGHSASQLYCGANDFVQTRAGNE